MAPVVPTYDPAGAGVHGAFPVALKVPGTHGDETIGTITLNGVLAVTLGFAISCTLIVAGNGAIAEAGITIEVVRCPVPSVDTRGGRTWILDSIRSISTRVLASHPEPESATRVPGEPEVGIVVRVGGVMQVITGGLPDT